MNFADFIYSNAFVLMFFPVWVAFLITLNFLVPQFQSRHFTLNSTLISTGICTVYSVLLLFLTSTTGIFVNNNVFDWLRINGISFEFGFLLDNLSAFFLVIFTTISFLIQLFSYQYMKNEEGFHKFFVYLNLLNFSISGFLVSTNLIQSYMFMALSGIFSYLLTGFYYKKKSVSDAAKKYLIFNSVGDFLILLGYIFYVYFAIGFYDIAASSMLNFSSIYDLSQGLIPFATDFGFIIICGLILMGLMIKAMQFPFHILSLDLNEAPTPVMALIGSCTAIILGNYIVIRFLPVFNLSSVIIKTIYFIGLITLLYCAICACLQNNIKKIISYIVCSQTGLIFMALSIFSVSSALFHFVIISISTVLLILLTGIVIKLFDGVQDIRLMGGLRTAHPYIAASFLTAVISISGLFFSGFFSKFQILSAFLCKGMLSEFSFILLSVFLVSYSCFRLYLNIFEGEKVQTNEINLHFPIKFSLFVLVSVVAIIGFFANNFIGNLFDAVIKTEISLKGMGCFVIINILALISAFLFGKLNIYKTSFIDKLNNFLNNYINEIFVFICKLWQGLCKIINFIDIVVIGGIEKFTAFTVKLGAVIVSKIQNSTLKSYIIGSIAGIILAFLLVIYYYCKLEGV